LHALECTFWRLNMALSELPLVFPCRLGYRNIRFASIFEFTECTCIQKFFYSCNDEEPSVAILLYSVSGARIHDTDQWCLACFLYWSNCNIGSLKHHTIVVQCPSPSSPISFELVIWILSDECIPTVRSDEFLRFIKASFRKNNWVLPLLTKPLLHLDIQVETAACYCGGVDAGLSVGGRRFVPGRTVGLCVRPDIKPTITLPKKPARGERRPCNRLPHPSSKVLPPETACCL
jgi:hypothetical protein